MEIFGTAAGARQVGGQEGEGTGVLWIKWAWFFVATWAVVIWARRIFLTKLRSLLG